jgi:hypothetical protein
MTSRLAVMDRLRAWSFAHPKARKVLREGWGVSRRTARAAHVPVPFDPAEFADVRRVSATRAATPPVASASAAPARRILFLSMRGWSTHVMWEVTMAYASELRGATAVFATCGGRLPICDAANVHSAPPMPCASCGEYAETALRTAGFDPVTLRDLVDIRRETAAARDRVASLSTVESCEEFTDGDLPLGRLVRISVAWFLARGTLPEQPEVVSTYRRFLVSGQVLHRAFAVLLDRVEPDRITLLNGTFFAEAILIELAGKRGIPVTTYERGFLTDSIVVTAGRPAAELLVDDESWMEAAGRPLTSEEDAALDEQLAERTRGERQPDNFWKNRIEGGRERVAEELHLGSERHLAVLFSNILWDSAVQGKDIAFSSMSEWILDTIAGFEERRDCDLVIRLHPAEARLLNHRTVERMGDIIAARFPTLPANVRVVQPESHLSSYSLMDVASFGLVYTSTAGLEMAVRGLSVLVSARTHYRGRGFTDDIEDPHQYWSVVDQLRAAPFDAVESARRRELARRYAALFLLRFMQPLDLVHETSRGRPRLTYGRFDALGVGRSAVLDRVSAGVLNGDPVVTPSPGRA